MSANASPYIFISHATVDDDFVRELRIKLELLDLSVWVDSRNLRGGDQLKPEIEQAIRDAGQVIVVLSPQTINSAWVRKEIQLAEQVAEEMPDYRVIPLLLPGVEPSALTLWFKEEPVGINIQIDPGQLQEKLPDILAALGGRLPDDAPADTAVEVKSVAELLLELSNPKLTQQADGVFQLSSEAELEYIPADIRLQPQVKSRPFRFISPIGQIEQDDLRWYLEQYPGWPTGLFQQRAQAIEARLPEWGQTLYAAVLANPVCREAVTGWQLARNQVERRFSIRVEAALLAGADDEERENALEATSKLLSLPWELLHDGTGYLSAGAYPVSLRRRLPNYANRLPLVMQLPIRILLLSPRPEQAGVAYIDHRASALPLLEAVESLGDLVQLRVLTPPTLPALETELKRALDADQPYHVLHFDGHGIYDPKYGLGALCFEDPKESHKLQQRGMQLVYAKASDKPNGKQQANAQNLASLLRDYRIPLVFLEACQTTQSEADPHASVAASLLEEGIASVIAMSHSVLVESALRFVRSFYGALALGQRVGQALLAGQRTLIQETFRLPIPGAGELHLQDWFVPILYQEQHDPSYSSAFPAPRQTACRPSSSKPAWASCQKHPRIPLSAAAANC